MSIYFISFRANYTTFGRQSCILCRRFGVSIRSKSPLGVSVFFIIPCRPPPSFLLHSHVALSLYTVIRSLSNYIYPYSYYSSNTLINPTTVNMRFFETILSAAAFAAAVAALEINQFPAEGVVAGQTYTITYSPADDTPTTFILRQGKSTDLDTVGTLTSMSQILLESHVHNAN